MPVVYLSSADAAVVVAYRRGDRNPPLGAVLDAAGRIHGKSGTVVYKEIMSFLQESNCKLPMNAVI